MNLGKSASVLLAAAAVLLGCTSTLPPAPTGAAPAATAGEAADLQAVYEDLGRSGGRVFALAPARSRVRIYVFRAGRAARLGHNHVISAPAFTGYFHLPLGGSANGRFDLVLRLDQLKIDNAADRAALGSSFAKAVTPEDIAGTREHMLGPDCLQADRFPLVHIQSLQISGEAPKFAARIRVELHGQQREMWIPLELDGLPDRLSASGSFVLRQSDFGVRPYSLLGGLLSVHDELVVDFTLEGLRT